MKSSDVYPSQNEGLENIAVPLAEGGETVSRDAKAPTEAFKKHLEAMSRRLKKVPRDCRKGFKDACEGKASPRQAIKAKCYECVGYENLKENIAGCTAYGCPLFAYRPYKEEGDQG